MTQQRPSVSSGPSTALILLLALTACGESVAEPPTVAVRDSAGIRIVENVGPAWGEEEVWRIGTEPLLEIGMDEGPAAYLLDQVRGALQLPDGRLVVANAGSGELRYFGPDGTHLRSAGGRGDGPGEFQDISWIDGYPGDSLVAYDARSRRVSVLSADGTFGRAITSTGADDGSLPQLRGAFADGRLFGRLPVPIAGDVATGMRRPDAVYATFSTVDGSLLDSLAILPDEARHILAEPQMVMVTSTLLPVRTYEALSGDSLFLGNSGSFEVRVYGGDGALRHLIRRSGDPVPVTEADLALLTEDRLDSNDEDFRRQMSRVLEMMPAPDVRPAFAGLLADDVGNLWVQETVLPGEPTRWSVFDSAGRLLGTLQFPGDDFRPLHIGEDFILGVASDELDVQRVRMYALER